MSRVKIFAVKLFVMGLISEERLRKILNVVGF